MNTERITGTLEWAMSRGVGPFVPIQPEDPTSYQARMHENNIVSTDESTLEAVREVLRGEPELQEFDGGTMFAKPGSSILLELRALARWLLAQTRLYGSRTAVERLQEFVEGQHRGVLEVMALTGIEPENEIGLARGLVLVPFSSVPQSPLTEQLSFDPLRDLDDPIRNMFVPVPTAALVSTNEDGIELLRDFPDPNDATFSTQRLFGQIVECLTLVGPSSPVALGQWTQLKSPERVPIMGMRHASNHASEEAYPKTVTTLPGDGTVPGLIKKHLALSEDLQGKLSISLRRLNLALRREDPADKAIELGIALEALLVNDGERGISRRVRDRGAQLSGGTRAEREKNRQLLHDMYNLRSEAVHSGKFTKPTGWRKTKLSSDEILREGAALCADLIRSVVERGSVPHWGTP